MKIEPKKEEKRERKEVKPRKDQVKKPEAPKSKDDLKKLNTTLCAFVAKGDTCRYGTRCKYTHDMDKAEISNCPYKKCGLVKKESGLYVNCAGRICYFIHNSETKKHYYSRIYAPKQ